MSSSYAYSVKVNEALESYGAKTHGSLERRVERLKRFNEQKNRRFETQIRAEHARMVANQEREERVRNRIREVEEPIRRHQEVSLPVTTAPYNLRSRDPEYGMNLLCRAIQNGFVNTNRG